MAQYLEVMGNLRFPLTVLIMDVPIFPTKKALPIGSAGLSVFRAAGDHARILRRDTKRTIARSPFLPRHPCSLNPSNLKNLFLTP